MEHLLEFKIHSDENFWRDVDICVSDIIKDNNFYPFHDLRKKYSDVIKESDNPDEFLVILHNKNRIKKQLTFGQWIWMWLLFILDINRNRVKIQNKTYVSKKSYFDDKGKGFTWWLNNESVTLYRGVPSFILSDGTEYPPDKKPDIGLEKNEYRSFTFDFEMALRFTQTGWMQGAWKDEKERNGIIYEIQILPKDIHLVSNLQYEEEAVVKGPINYTNHFIIRKGEIK